MAPLKPRAEAIDLLGLGIGGRFGLNGAGVCLFRDRAAGWVDEASCFFSGVIGVTGCAPPVDFGPGVTPALFSVAFAAAVLSAFGFAPFVGPLPASSVDTAPFVGPLPASAFGCASAGAERPTVIAEISKVPRNKDMSGLL
jgi:hypothetical protein